VVANTKQAKKEAALWGDLPTGSRAELISDIAKILDEAITNIDDVSARDERNPLIAKSLRRLAQAVNTIMEQIKPMSTTAKGEAEIATFEQLNENAQSILEAANKLPPPEVEKKTKTKSN
jgi:acyl-CoA reductase-like NAD-dependent aldehyde dehydrogenase